jgi:hypothetical protein
LNLVFKQWGTVFPGAACVVAVVDRFARHSHGVEILGESWRDKHRLDADEVRSRQTGVSDGIGSWRLPKRSTDSPESGQRRWVVSQRATLPSEGPIASLATLEMNRRATEDASLHQRRSSSICADAGRQRR